MRKKLLITAVGAALVLATISIVTPGHSEPLAQLVAELGPPTFLAKRAQIVKFKGEYLNIQLLDLDPKAVTNWHSITNVLAIWAESKPCRRNARYLYDDIKAGKSLDGGGFYGSEFMFGEKLSIVKIDTTGTAITKDRVRVYAVSMHTIGFVPRKSATSQ